MTVLGFGEERLGHLGRLAESWPDVDSVLPGLRVARQVVADERHHTLVDVGIGEGQLGGAEHLTRPNGEQSRVPWPGSHEQDPSVGVLADWAHRLFSSAVLCG